jgi:hypothetical protein
MAKKEILTSLTAAIILYAVVIVYQGYQYGQGDQSQILPCLWAQDHPGTYAHDHYVTHYLSSGINERTIFHFLLRHAGYDQPWLVWLWHALSGIGLILALISISSLFISNKVWQWLSIGMILTIGFHTSTGSNELYYNLFIPSLPAKALAAWAIYFWLRNKYAGWIVLLILAGYLQPLVGVQVFILTTTGMLIEKWKNPDLIRIPWRLLLLYIIATAPWMILLILNNGSGHDPQTFMNIMEFRLSHHFFASYFGLLNLLLGLFFAIISIWFYKDKLKWFLITILVGCIVYEIGVELMRSPLVLYTQWWKTTIWMEALAIIALVAFFEKIKSVTRLFSKLNLILPVSLLLIVSFYRLSGFFGEIPDYMLPWVHTKTSEVDISEIAQKLTPENATFIIPPDLTAFRWYSKRDTYVDYKAMIHNEPFLKDWYDRINEIYGYNLDLKKSGISFIQQANETLKSRELITRWKSLGVTHLISATSGISDLQFISGNQRFSLYKIQ